MFVEHYMTEDMIYTTGAKREVLEPRYDLIPPDTIRRLALIYTEGAKRYGEHNWQKGLPYSTTVNHLIEHLLKWLESDTSEDHLAKVIWGCAALMYYEDNCKHCDDLFFGKSN